MLAVVNAPMGRTVTIDSIMRDFRREEITEVLSTAQMEFEYRYFSLCFVEIQRKSRLN